MLRTFFLAALAFLLAIPSAAARFGLPEAHTERGQVIAQIYEPVFIAAAIVFVFVVVWLAIVLVRYRQGSGHGKATYEVERENLKLEMAWIIVPLFVVLWVGWISYVGLVALDEDPAEVEPDLAITIVGSQWNWEAVYGDGVSVFANPDDLGRVTDEDAFLVPADAVVRYSVTAVDVIHAFYVQEMNGAPVALVDANPSGPNKFNDLTFALPEGEYIVQCKEMCLNPGHAVMRARIVAVPQADFDLWLEEKQLEAACSPLRVHDVAIEVTDGNLSVDGSDTLATTKDTCVLATVTNTLSEPVTLEVPGLGQERQIPGFSTEFWSFNVETAGTFLLTGSHGAEAQITAVEAQVIEVELDEWAVIPTNIELEAGQTYLFNVRNIGETAHNIYIGEYANSESEVAANSQTINGGVTTSFVFTPPESGTLDTWCDVPGHYDQGMVGTATIA